MFYRGTPLAFESTSNELEDLQIEIYAYLEDLDMDDIDEHLFMLIRLKPDNNQEIGLLILPMLSGPNPATSVKNNFNSVFEILSVGVSSFNRKGNPDSLQNELFKEISKFSGTPKVILSFLDSAHDNLRTQNFLFSLHVGRVHMKSTKIT